MGVILVEGISFIGKHGLYASELREGRQFEVDVRLELDLRAAGATDELTETVDYTRICALVLEIGQKRSFRLIERLAQEIAQQALTLGPVQAVEVEVRKYVPDLPGSPRFVGVRIRRQAARS